MPASSTFESVIVTVLSRLASARTTAFPAGELAILAASFSWSLWMAASVWGLLADVAAATL